MTQLRIIHTLVVSRMKARSCFGRSVGGSSGCAPLMSDCFSCLELSSKMPFAQKRGTNNTSFCFVFYLVWKELPEQGVENTSSLSNSFYASF